MGLWWTLKYKRVGKIKKDEITVLESRWGRERVIKKKIDRGTEIYVRLKDIESPYLPKVYSVKEGKGVTVILEEYIDGETLEDAISRERDFKKGKKLYILGEICRGLEVLHENGIVHRDIKPTNVMIEDLSERKPKVKLIDFDIAREIKEGKVRDTEILGTEGFAPPEQYGAGQTDERSDIYALGRLAERLFGGYPTGGVGRICRKCTQADPKRRYKNVGEVRRRLWFEAKKKYIYMVVLILAAGGICFGHCNKAEIPDTASETASYFENFIENT